MATRSQAIHDTTGFARRLRAALATFVFVGVAANPVDGAGAQVAVVYAEAWNGAITEEGDRRVLIAEAPFARLFQEILGTPNPQAPVELGFFDRDAQVTRETALFPDGNRATVTTPFDSLPAFTITDEAKDILGFRCTKATTEIRSNHIEVWFTREAGITGSPSLRLLVPGALVLETRQNGNQGLVAQSIERDPDRVTTLLADQPTPFVPPSWGESLDAAAYRARLAASWVTTVPVFTSERIAFHPSAGEPDPGTIRYADGTVIVRRVVLPEVPDDTMVLAALTERSRGDAYDRTGSVFLVPTDRPLSFLDGLRDSLGALPVLAGREGVYQGVVATEGYLPPLELIRFITPFGVGHWNAGSRLEGLTWVEEADYVMDLTDLLPRLRGEVWIGAFIGNYDAGGHEIDLELRYYPWSRTLSPEPPAPRWTLPLFNTLNAMEMAGQNYGTLFAQDTLRVTFDAPPGLADCRLRYLTTGHGGWGGGDEFNPKPNVILLDGVEVARFVPWRSDCGTFRELNPSSGNFWNGLSSSDFSRSGWCPGTTVSPAIIPLGPLTAGRHEIAVAIPMGAPEGGSFSSWNVSGVLLGEFAPPAVED